MELQENCTTETAEKHVTRQQPGLPKVPTICTCRLGMKMLRCIAQSATLSSPCMLPGSSYPS
eukprot:601789-Amphidinium_carterae.1